LLPRPPVPPGGRDSPQQGVDRRAEPGPGRDDLGPGAADARRVRGREAAPGPDRADGRPVEDPQHADVAAVEGRAGTGAAWPAGVPAGLSPGQGGQARGGGIPAPRRARRLRPRLSARAAGTGGAGPPSEALRAPQAVPGSKFSFEAVPLFAFLPGAALSPAAPHTRPSPRPPDSSGLLSGPAP